MAEEKEEAKTPIKKKSGWFSKIPVDKLLSPGGIILVFMAIAIEVIDFLVPLPILDQVIEIPLEVLFIGMLVFILDVPLKTAVIPFALERLPILNDFLPTWFLRMLM